MNIFISMVDDETTATFITPYALSVLEKVGTVSRNTTGRKLTVDDLVVLAQDADVIFCGWGTEKFTKELVSRLPNLKIIAYVAGSMARVVEREALQNGVVALTGNYIFAQSVAEGCLAYTLYALREIGKNVNMVRSGGWRNEVFYNQGLIGKKVGIIGFGEIAKNFVKLLKPFDVEILVNSGHMSESEATLHGVRKASREEIFLTCDVVSLHLALTEKTIGSIDRSLLELLKPNAVLVNTARGAIVDEEAMIELLQEKRFYAALDVFAEEPLPLDSVLRKPMDNVLVMPHMGGPTIDMREYIVLSFAEDLEAYKRGELMKNLFSPEDLSHMTDKG